MRELKMKNDEIRRILSEAFPCNSDEVRLSDEFIATNDDLLDIQTDFHAMLYVPAYMDWCVRNCDNYNQLVTDRTINALAEYGRAKNAQSDLSNFKFKCNEQQKTAVRSFYSWCLANLLFVQREQIERSIKHWI
jgi:hypothetical protein